MTIGHHSPPFENVGHPALTVVRIAFLMTTALGLSSPAMGGGDTDGVSPNTISRPSGPGSLEGLGASFQPALNTGTAQHTVLLALPSGVAGFTPSLSLQYDGGKGFGVAGVGWTFGPARVRRQVEKGLPRYGEAPDGENIPDRFMGMEGEQLVPLQNGYYLAKIEKLYIRYRFTGDHWEAHTKSGIKLEFGITPQGRVTNADGSKTFSWCLQRQTDTHGNVIEYTYAQPTPEDRQIYLSEVRYGPGGPPWTQRYAARMTYEDRPDPFTDYRCSFKVRTSKRLAQVDVLYDEQLIRRYRLGYEAHPHWSLLTTITTYGADSVSTLPPMVLGYSLFDSGDGLTPISAAGHILGSQGEPPEALDSPGVGLIDLNADGLADLLATGTGHVAYLNRGVQDTENGPSIIWDGPVDLSAEEDRAVTFELSSDRVHLADMTGDGIADLVVTDSSNGVEYFENTGQTGWSMGRLMATEQSPPPAPFGSQGASTKTSDLGFNKRIDIIQSQSGALLSWFNQGDGQYTGPIVTDAPYDGSSPVEFSDLGVFLADMNGDRLVDVAKITTSGVLWWANRGYSRFGPRVEMGLPDRFLDDSPGGNLHRARLEDVSGDGLSDLVVEQAQGSDLWFWQNLGNGQFETSRVVIDLPVTPNATARWADLNGNGTTDLVYTDSTLATSRIQVVDLGELIGGSPHFNLLTSIDYAYGRKTEIVYRTTTQYLVDAFVAGHPWATSAPFPSFVVSEARTSIGLDLDGFEDEGPDGDVYVVEFVYRDGYYDPIEHQFRGFAFVKQIDVGDERFGGTDAPSVITRHAFHTGAPDGVDNDGDGETDEPGDLWTGREEEPLKGTRLWAETTSMPDDPLRDGSFADDAQVFERTTSAWEVRELCRADGGALVDLLGDVGYRTADAYGRQVRQAVQTQVDTSVIEQGRGPAKLLRSFSDVDALGNPVSEWTLGDVSNPDDDLYTGYEYALNEPDWIVNRASRTFQTESAADGAFVSETRHYYDGTEFEGLPLGQIDARGVLHRTESLISKDIVPPLIQRSLAIGDPRNPNGKVDLLRQQVDAYGNPIVLRDANGNDRLIEYDGTMHKYPIRETIVLGNGQADLEVLATYDLRIGRLLTLTDMNGHVSRFSYDTFGRLTREFLPGDEDTSPTTTYSYDLGAPISAITTVAHDNVTDTPDLTAKVFFDGLGRKLGTYQPGGGVTGEVTLYNARGTPRKVYQPYFGGGGTWSVPPDTVPATTCSYDAAGRVTQTVTPPDDDGLVAIITSEYLPLAVKQYDGEDNKPGGRHENTPKTLVRDGLGRLIEVHEIETISQVDSGTFVTNYRYAGPDRLGEIEDSNGNVKYMRYDGLGRRIFVNDIDRGYLTYTYDAMGNPLSRVDALNQETVYTYDGANRLVTEDYLDDGHPLSMHRTPDVAFHYDGPHPDYPWIGNVKGSLSWVEDLTGGQVYGNDDRGFPETVVKQIDQPDGSTLDYTMVALSDNLGRVYQTTYPDGDVVRFTYDARGLLQAIPGFVEQLTYEASGQKATCLLSNGVLSTYAYDPRQRLRHLLTQSSAETLQDLWYDYDQVADIVGITDGRSLPPDDLRNQTATFALDNHYRLGEAMGPSYGTIAYDYDRLGNMAFKASPDIVDDDVNLGMMTSGGLGGTTGRVGRAPGEPPGPHAVTHTDNGVRARTFEYDANGNMISNDGEVYTYDFADRLGKVVKDGKDIRYLYDHTGRRVIKRVDGVQTSYISNTSELRDGRMIKYVSAASGRLARIEGPIPPPTSAVQVIALNAGWNLISFQVDPGETDPQTVLASIDGLYLAVYGHDGVDYTRYIPGSLDNTLLALLPNRGYWIKMTQAAQLDLEGPISGIGVDIPANTPMLVGVPGLASRSAADLATQLPGIDRIWGYEPQTVDWSFYSSSGPSYVNSLQETQSGRAYWILSSVPITLTMPNAGGVYYYHTDHLGSTNVVTDDVGDLVTETYNYPFGSPRHKYDTGSDFNPYYLFTGKEQDAESGLHYFGGRYYDSVVSRFVTTDPQNHADREAGLLEPQRGDAYSFALNNPMEMIDPNGQAAKHTVKIIPARPGAPREIQYTIESTVYVYFDRDTDIHNWLTESGSWDPARAKEIADALQKDFKNRVPESTAHKWGFFNVRAKFIVTPGKPVLTAAQKKGATLLRIRRRTESERKPATGRPIWGRCHPAAGHECWFGEDPGGGADNANIYVDSAGNLKVSGKGHYHEILHGFGLPHAVARNKAGEMTPVGVQDIMGYNSNAVDTLTPGYQYEYVVRAMRIRGYKNQTFSGSDVWGMGDVTSRAIQSAYDLANR